MIALLSARVLVHEVPPSTVGPPRPFGLQGGLLLHPNLPSGRRHVAGGRLGWINDAFTVAFWVRPDQDYTGGSAWAWSFGRPNLWRLVSLFTSGYSLSKTSVKTPDVFILSAVSTALSFASLAISLWTLF